MSQIILERYDDFTGGLNLRADQFQLARNESPDMLNVEIDPRGGVFSRGAMQRLNTTAVAGTWAPNKLHAFYGDTSTVMLANSTKVYRSTGNAFTTLAYSSGNDIATANADGASFANWGSTLYISTGATGTASIDFQRGTISDVNVDFRMISDAGRLRILSQDDVNLYTATTSEIARFTRTLITNYKDLYNLGNVSIGLSPDASYPTQLRVYNLTNTLINTYSLNTISQSDKTNINKPMYNKF
jgi:hypothetical protein